MHDLDETTLRRLFTRAAEGEEPPLGSLVADARRAASAIRRRRGLVRATGGLAAVAVLAAAIPALGRGAAGPVRLRPDADVIGQAERAVAAENRVLHAESAVAGGRVVTWAYRDRVRYEQYRPGGGPLETDSGTAVVAGALTGVVVTYHPGIWYRVPAGTFTRGPVSGCGARALAVAAGGSPPDWPSFIRATLACGAATVAGHATVNGAETIKINSNVTVAQGSGAARAWLRVRYVIYLDPATYLPVRLVSEPVLRRHGSQRSPASFPAVANFRWLPPTAANVARVSVPIPAGFGQRAGRAWR